MSAVNFEMISKLSLVDNDFGNESSLIIPSALNGMILWLYLRLLIGAGVLVLQVTCLAYWKF